MKHIKNYRLFELHQDFSDAKTTIISPEQLAKDLNSEIERIDNNKTLREKDKVNKIPIITRNMYSTFTDENGAFDAVKFRELITERPKTIFDQNPKMVKTDYGVNQVTVNTGIPALKAIVVDENTGKFHYVNTCPGAGSCIIACYARHGFYTFKDEKVKNLINRLNFMMNDPDGYIAQILDELKPIAHSVKDMENGFDEYVMKLRWNDAGDFFSKKYLEIAKTVTKELSKICNVQSYAYSKISEIVIDGNENDIAVNFSTDASTKEINKAKLAKDKIEKYAIIIPRSVFKGFFKREGAHIAVDQIRGLPLFKDKNEKELLRQAVVDYINENNPECKTSIDRVLFTPELSKIPESGRNKYDVIVLPKGDSDISAQRRDVRCTFLLQH
jgi:hypothetical protein